MGGFDLALNQSDKSRWGTKTRAPFSPGRAPKDNTGAKYINIVLYISKVINAFYYVSFIIVVIFEYFRSINSSFYFSLTVQSETSIYDFSSTVIILIEFRISLYMRGLCSRTQKRVKKLSNICIHVSDPTDNNSAFTQ